MELVLIGLGGCSGYDVVHILEKGRQAIADVAVELEAERAEQDPKVFTRIHMHFVVKGRRLTAEKVERAIALSVEKHCSASAMIAKTATITTTSRLSIPTKSRRERTDSSKPSKRDERSRHGRLRIGSVEVLAIA